ncbi:Glycerol-3-phosphate dehydrogenase [NAD(P)+] [hydrothermal vent metagenome]|uniref:Glycerol-3-phosphate dehydrogenase [NAD(P)+] n=1 Tax=hydrothermal vent metagenome TaxID=652676 RepID=A0A3B1BD76_9ZZZZ
MTRPCHRISVLGAGSWGTALAMLLASNGHAVQLWTHRAARADEMLQAGENRAYLPGLAFPDALQVSADLAAVVTHAEILLIVVPSHVFRQTLSAIKPFILAQHKLAWATKGLEPDSRKLLSQQVKEELGENIATAVVSGPTFAREVAQKLPGAVTVAASNPAFASELAEALHADYFRAYTGSDVVGVEVGGAVKNVLAIAAGAVDGLGFGANARAALIARGLAEVTRLGVALGAETETFTGLTGLGDLVLTCTDNQSRNRRLGLAVGQGKEIAQAINDIGQVVEGFNTSREVHALAQSLGVDMPITEQICKVLHQGRSPKEAVQALMGRSIRAEHD